MKILVPSLGESITEATVAKWLKKKGDLVKKDEVLVELETDKATLEVYAQTDGKLSEIYFEAGKDVQIGAELADYLEGPQNNLIIETKKETKKIEEENIEDVNNNKVEEKIFVPESTIMARSSNEIHLDPVFAPGGGNSTWCLPFDQQAVFYFSYASGNAQQFDQDYSQGYVRLVRLYPED